MNDHEHSQNGAQSECLILWGDNPEAFIVLADSSHAVDLTQMA